MKTNKFPFKNINKFSIKDQTSSKDYLDHSSV